LWQAGVNAPGTPNRMTFFPLKMSFVVTGAGPFSVICVNVPSGSRSPTPMAMRMLLSNQ